MSNFVNTFCSDHGATVRGDMDTPGERLRKARLNKGFDSAAALGRRIGLASSTVRAHEADTRGIGRTAEKYARALGVSPEWLLFGSGDEPSSLPAAQDIGSGMVEVGAVEFASIGRYDAALSAGPGSLIDPYAAPLGYMLFEAQWLRAVTAASPSALAVVQVDGDSMEDTLRHGDWVLVDRTQARVGREGIYALQVGENTWVKRLSLNLRDKLIRIISDNPVYPVQDMPDDEVQIIGRIVWIVGRRLT